MQKRREEGEKEEIGRDKREKREREHKRTSTHLCMKVHISKGRQSDMCVGSIFVA